MRIRKLCEWMVLVLAVLFNCPAYAGILDFDSLSDGQVITNQIAGFSFSNSIALQAGISLNEFEFPPRSGNVVLSDDAGPMEIRFSTPISSFGAYFTYAEPLKITAFDGNGNVVASAMSVFWTNTILSGDPGSAPNELLSLIFAAGISKIEILGNAAGASFSMDDLSVSLMPAEVPEPASTGLFVVALLAGALNRRFFPSRWSL